MTTTTKIDKKSKIEEGGEHILSAESDGKEKLKMEPVVCCLCGTNDADPVGTGEDFEYRTSRDQFTASRCRRCGLVYLNPRPAISEFNRIYPDSYHAFEFSEKEFGFVYKVRRRLEANRLLVWCRDLPEAARILDVGCGDGFHLDVLAEYGKKSWTLEGIDTDERAVEIGRKNGLTIHHGTLGTVDLAKDSYDLVLLIQTIEHVADPPELLRQIRSLLRPGGRLVIVTDNTDSLDFTLFKNSYWGGYHFPRHWNLFNRATIGRIAQKTGFEIEKMTTQVSPVNWVYSIRNSLTGSSAVPKWLIEQFSLKSTVSLGIFTIFDALHNLVGRGALLNAVIKRPD